MSKNTNLKIFLKYMFAAIGSSLILSIYTFVDSICIGQYEGPQGSAAVAVCMPVWTLIYSTGLLFAIGGATIMMAERGRRKLEKGNAFFTLSFFMALAASLILTLIFNVFNTPLLKMFGAHDPTVLRLVKKYTFYMRIALPFYLFSQYMITIIRNDNDPTLATISTLLGGIINSILDVYLVFNCDMGIAGAGLATMIGQIATALIPCIHFFKKSNKLKFVKIRNIKEKSFGILKIGFSSFILDIAMGLSIIIFNNQISRYASTPEEVIALGAVYGAICNVVVLVQGLGYAIGHASEPLLSEALGEGDFEKIAQYKKYGIISAIILGIIAFAVCNFLPSFMLKMLADASKDSLTMRLGIRIERIYFLAFAILSLNIVYIYYFNSILRPKESFFLAILRGIGFPIIFLLIIPVINFDYIWLSPVLSELLVLFTAIILSTSYKKKLKLALNHE